MQCELEHVVAPQPCVSCLNTTPTNAFKVMGAGDDAGTDGDTALADALPVGAVGETGAATVAVAGSACGVAVVVVSTGTTGTEHAATGSGAHDVAALAAASVPVGPASPRSIRHCMEPV